MQLPNVTTASGQLVVIALPVLHAALRDAGIRDQLIEWVAAGEAAVIDAPATQAVAAA